MRIAQAAPLFESVPPKYYGGTERIVSYLTKELVRRGHQDAVEAVRRVPELSRKQCREVFEQRFIATRMTHNYVEVYEWLIKSGRHKALEAHA
jgi:glycosyltransferase involved in cell wall biosynthesis